VAEKRQIISRNEQNEVSPPHRIAGGVVFETHEAERSTSARETKRAATKGDRALRNQKQFEKAARSRKRQQLNVY
jgi:hypothetical protein